MEGLSVEMKVAYAQNMWNHYFVYDDSKAIGDQVHARAEEAHLSEEELKCRIAARILNRSRGICNLSATGFVLLLKAIGVPSRLCAGYWKQGASSGRHAWVEYWNGEEWLTHESQVGVRSRDQFIGKSVEDVLRAFDDRIRELSRSVEANQAEVTDLSASKVALLAELEASEAARESIRMEVRRVSEQRDTMEQALRAELAELTASGKDREGLLKRQLSDAGADVLERDLLIAQARRALEALRDENPLMVTRGGYQERLTRELGFLDQQES